VEDIRSFTNHGAIPSSIKPGVRGLSNGIDNANRALQLNSARRSIDLLRMGTCQAPYQEMSLAPFPHQNCDGTFSFFFVIA
jgi:hypothetical protein